MNRGPAWRAAHRPQGGLRRRGTVRSVSRRLNNTLKLSYDAFATHLQQTLLPAYLISGDEPLLTGEAADAVRARARESGFTEREVHFADRSTDWESVRASATMMSLFAARRIIEVRLPTGKPGTTGGRVLTALIEARDPDTLLLVLTGRLDRDAQSTEWVRAAEAHGGWLPVWPISPERLVPWLRARCKRMNLTASEDALELLADRTEGNLLAAQQELEKLRLLADGGRITADTVLTSVADSARFDVSGLTDALLEGDAARALRVLEGLRTEGVELPLVLWAVNKALQDVWSTTASGTQDPRGRGGWQRPSAALDKARRRAPQLHYPRLTARAERADRMAKGRMEGNAWDELALLAADVCGRPAVSLSRARP